MSFDLKTHLKCLWTAQTNHICLNISGSEAMHWNFQCVKCVNKHVEQDDGRKVVEAEFQERIRKEWAGLHRGEIFSGFWFRCSSINIADHWPAELRNLKACLSSNRFESEKQKSLTRRWLTGMGRLYSNGNLFTLLSFWMNSNWVTASGLIMSTR